MHPSSLRLYIDIIPFDPVTLNVSVGRKLKSLSADIMVSDLVGTDLVTAYLSNHIH